MALCGRRPAPAGNDLTLYADIREVILDGAPPPVSVDGALPIMRVLQAATGRAASARMTALART